MIREGIGGRPTLTEAEAYRVATALRRLRNERFDGNGTLLAAALGLSPSAVSQLLSGRTRASHPTVAKIAAMLEIPADALLSGAPIDPRLPHRVTAAEICRAGGVQVEAIDAVLAEQHDVDHPVLWWIDRIRARATLLPAPHADSSPPTLASPVSSKRVPRTA